MPAFRFRAQAALDLRRRQEEEAQRALAVARLALQEAAQRLAGLEAERAAAMAAARQAESAADMAARAWHRSWIERGKQEIARQAESVRDRERDVRQAQQEALRARQKRRALELYRDRMWRAFQRDAARAEQKAIDELATLRFVALRTPSEGDVT